MTGVVVCSMTFSMLVMGCGSKRPGELPVYPVKGRATYKGEPMTNAAITFFPAGEVMEQARNSRAYADKDGNFQLTTYELNDGVPAGEYSVILWWPEGDFDPKTQLINGNEKCRLKFEYQTPKAPKLKVTVKPEPNTFDITLP